MDFPTSTDLTTIVKEIGVTIDEDMIMNASSEMIVILGGNFAAILF